ncbi:MAG: reactive intermediate/imine deaminase [Sphingobacteriia bacterium 24-36-13]|jgi:2-iminobutanoate/2-iminopropanoate deaminase|uniref:RidA family protein n=1 Tax=Sediminibacterium sp. TaxID=1917865 RepID=UPI000BC743B2|nr:RidA family protein [Sediminibacterium sp.]OYY09392.1 MAG: reactive intermediate/imine deaminase [Sphingobacteriia bacterium 35-36-14]OYZ52367.1 MAG: reactive intermediate/imine deaminase [Sphingobacteriia bacterium 24-36-13]OZA64084.1 MAG: reactive intermediate/imine deaminase [Sphingobacteriia bacterium 39-36-14]MBT9485748.1 RidA family protein [Sediminibacterium sp.]HQS24461.1 RidA family protein [Sediminibacterium sp.]
MSKQVVKTVNAPSPIGPYNQAIKANGFVFLSGQVAFDPTTGALVQDNIAAETHQVMKNIEAVLKEAKLSFEHIVKTTIFLSDMALFAEVNEVYGTYFNGDYPARETVAVKGLPRGVNVEISMTAVVDL